MQHGITFSHRQLQFLRCNVDDALQQALSLNFDYLRLCLYWDELEPQAKQFNWKIIQNILQKCQENQQAVVLTIGVKAPRWPEFYFPSWLETANITQQKTQDQLLQFISQALLELKSFSCIKYYQVENEALDPSGPKKKTIPLAFLKKEIELVRQLDPDREIITTLWGNQLSKRKILPKLAPISDIVGIDLYYRQFIKEILNQAIYIGPGDTSKKISQIIKQTQTKQKQVSLIWIMELQAEPWESSNEKYLSVNPASISPQKIIDNYKMATKLPISTIFFWGYEYWYYRSQQGDSRYLKTIANLI